MSEILSLNSVTKKFGDVVAVNDVSLTVGKGDIVGFLGPNGAGKSTSLRMAMGILRPDLGHVHLFGDTPKISEMRRLGFLAEERGLYKRMTARNTIGYFAQLKGMSRRAALTKADDLLEATGLGAFRNSRINKLSKGMAQKVQILATIAHQPELLILDEPFSGLDPVNQQELETLLLAEHARGATLLFSTHVMEHAERICQNIIMIAGGRKVFDGSVNEAFEHLDKAVQVSLPATQEQAEKLDKLGLDTERLEVENDGQWWRIKLGNLRSSQEVLRMLLDSDVHILGFKPETARLRDVFVHLAQNLPELAVSEEMT